MTPTVSVVIAFLDPDPRFLDEAVESVVAQTFRDWEIVFVNDGSGPPALEAVRAWSSAHPDRMRILEHPGGRNRGLAASRRLGIASARGRLVAFLDSDDVWLPERLERHVELLRALPSAGMVYGPSIYWHSWNGRDTDADHVPALGVPARTVLPPPGSLPAFLVGRAAVPCPGSVTIRTSLLREVGGGEPSQPDLYEDQILWSKLMLHAPVCTEDRVLDRYRQHETSMVARSGAAERRAARRSFLEWLDRYLDTRPPVPSVRKAVRRELWAVDHPLAARVLRFFRRIPRRVARLHARASA